MNLVVVLIVVSMSPIPFNPYVLVLSCFLIIEFFWLLVVFFFFSGGAGNLSTVDAT